ncbi:MAG: hypothetical protein R2860_06990 [Desulfobacterales bacterium]
MDGNGLDGLEQHYDNELQGTPQEWTIIKDRMGRIFDRQETCCMPGYEGKSGADH